MVEDVLTIIKHDEDANLKEVWVVFDFDVSLNQIKQQKEDFNNAIELAESNGLHVACSNDSFELWFLLHYQFLDVKWTRHQYYAKLSGLLGCNYEKKGKEFLFSRNLYHRLAEDRNASQRDAIKRAKRLHRQQRDLSPADRNPCTAVYLLVEELNGYL